MVARARKYIENRALPLTVRDITDVVEAHPVAPPRSMLDPIIFAIDDIVLSDQRKTKE